MFTYIFVDSKRVEIARRETDIELGINGFIRFENQNYRVSPIASCGKTLICASVYPNLIKYDPAVELVEFFKAVGITHLTPTNINEEGARDAFLSLISPLFEIEKEVPGTFIKPNKEITPLRIDAVLMPKQHEHKKLFDNYRAMAFGIEFKNPTKIAKEEGYSITEILGQCTNYTHTDFRKYGRIPVFAFPFFNHRAHIELLNYTADSNVGVITTHHSGEPYFAFRFGEMAFWDSRQGFTQLGQQRKLERKYGNRC